MSSEDGGQPPGLGPGETGAGGSGGGAAGGGGGQQPGNAGGGGAGAAGGGGGTGGSAAGAGAPSTSATTAGKTTGTKGPAGRTRQQKGKTAGDKGKKPLRQGAFENHVEAVLLEGDQMIKAGTDRLNEQQPDVAALRADADAVQHVADQVAALDFTGTLPALEERAQDAVALLAGLQRVHPLLTATADWATPSASLGAGMGGPPPLFPPATPSSARGGRGAGGTGSRSNSRRSSTSSGGGRRGGRTSAGRNSSASSPAGGGGAGSVVQRLQQMAAGAGGAGPPRGRWNGGGGSGSTGRTFGRSGSGFGVGGRRNPFDSDSCKLEDDFYFDLPFPWNALPRRDITSAVEVFKVAAVSLPKFNGTHSGYSSWRNCFIPCVHLTDIDVSHKCLMLRSSMEVKTARMREFVDGIVSNEDGYREAILKLEDRYGGDEALLLARQEALLAVPELREGEYRTVELLHSRLNTFLVEWAGVNGAEMDETESLAFYTLIMSKVEPTYTLRYLDWLRLNGLQKGLHSLHDWLAQQLKDHRAVELYHRRRTISLRSGGRTDGNHQSQMRRNSVPPPGHLDRNFRPQHKGFLTIDEEWEELEAAAGEEGEEVFGGDSHFLARPEVKKPLKCPICSSPHPLGSCAKFQAMKPRQRKDFLIQEGRCFLCFQNTHPVTKCRFRYNCAKCGGKHHTMIHGADENPGGSSHFLSNEGELDLEGAADVVNFGLLAGGEEQRKTVSLRTITLRVRNPKNGKSTTVNALLDDGCTGAGLISGTAAEELGLQGPTYWTSTEGVGGKITSYKTFLSRVEVIPSHGGPIRPLGVQVMKQPAGSYAPVDWTLHQNRFPHLADLPLHPPAPHQGVDLMIGSKVPWLSAALEERRGGEGDPIARLTPLGWTVAGPTHAALPQDRSSALSTLLSSTALTLPLQQDNWPESGRTVKLEECKLVPAEDISDKQLHRLVQRMLQEDEQVEVEQLSPREEYIVRQARDTLGKRGERYVVGCTWAPQAGRPHLNLPQAERRLRSLEASRHFKNEVVKNGYQEVVDGWKAGGEVKVVPYPSPAVRYLMPHFPVVNLEKTTTPVRVVMDCKVDLNKHLLSGPNLLNEVPAVLLRFRSGLYTFSGDVKKMFLRIYLPEEDKPFHCFLWRKPTGELEFLQFQVHVFGNAGSPFLALFVVKEHAKQFMEQHPKAVETIFHSTLVDDVLDSADSEEEAKETLVAVREIFASAGMEMAKFHSNSARVLQAVGEKMSADVVVDVAALGEEKRMPELKTLGLCYSPEGDQFFFRPPVAVLGKWTKRRVLKLFPRLYDPLGFLLPFSIRARIYFSSVASKDQGWDSLLPHSREWEAWVAQLQQLPLLRFPRCVKAAVPLRSHLHLFADASKEAYAAAAFIVCYYPDSTPTAHLVMARAHVAPKKLSTIPRLELRAAELAVRVRKTVLSHLKLRVDATTFWSDSLTVLYWLRDDAKRFQTFVHNKLQSIRRSSEQKEWRWVPTAQNPADLATRGLTPQRLAASNLWLHGPPFLLTETFPSCPQLLPTSDVISEMKKTEQLVLFQNESPPLPLLQAARYSTFRRLLSLCERVLLWRDRARLRLGLPPLSPPRIRAERVALHQAQITLREALASPSPKAAFRALGMTALAPFLDEEGLVRGRGRLSAAAALPRDVREPILLPRAHPLTVLLLRHAHEEEQKHAGGTAAALNSFLARFWTPRPRSQMYKLVRDCVACRRRLARPQRPPQAPLPKLRLPEEGGPVAFATTAFDCAGPYRVKRARSYEQHYLLLATCCHTRAVRMEALSDLSVDAFLMAFTRLSARGVNPTTVLTDNGGNFVAANRLLAELGKKLESEGVEARRPEVRWIFNPPFASHFGGVFERLIGAAKAALYHALPSHFSLSLEQLQTAFAEVEGLLNTRPLAYVGGEGAEMAALTPNHFLAGSASVPVIAAPWPRFAGGLAKRWEMVHKALEVFRRRFATEVLVHLRQATQARGAGRDLQVGDVVVFLLPSAHRKWPLALVHRTFPGRDGRVRVIDLWTPQTGGGEKLPPPPITASSDTGTRGAVGKEPISAPSDKKKEERPLPPSHSPTPSAANEKQTNGRPPPTPPAAENERSERPSPNAPPSIGGGPPTHLPPRSHGSYFRRDVGAVALLLPVEKTNLSHI